MSDLDLIPFCDAYASTPRVGRVAYVVSELRRLDREGVSLLRAVLSCADDEVAGIATSLLHGNADEEGAEIYAPRLWRLRLVEGAVPPSYDPQARPIKAEERGKVLRVKTGNKGGRLDANARPDQIEAHSGPRRNVASRAGRDIYDYVDVTREARSYSLRHAVIILRQWGAGIAPDQWRYETDRDGNQRQTQCNWLVEEVTKSSAKTAAPTAERGARAA